MSLSQLVLLSAFADSPIRYRMIVQEGDPVPGADGSAFQLSNVAPVINNLGDVAFDARMTKPNQSDVRALWTTGVSGLRMAASQFAPAPGTDPSVVFGGFIFPLVLGDGGQVAFGGAVTGPGLPPIGRRGFWSERADGLSLVYLAGTPAVGTAPGIRFSYFTDWPVINGAGQTAFWAKLTGSNVTSISDEGVWRAHGGQQELVAREGDRAPGYPPGVVLKGLSSYPQIDDFGRVIFWSGLSGPGIDSLTNEVIFRGEPGSLSPIMRAGDPIPELGDGVYLATLDPFLKSNRAGDTVQQTYLGGPGINNINSWCLVVDRGGQFSIAAREADPAPGAGDGAVFSYFELPAIGNGGHVAFAASIRGPEVPLTEASGIWLDRVGSLELIAREGSAAPGTEPGVVFGSFYYFIDLMVNGRGQVAFLAHVRGPGVDSANNVGVWATTHAGELRLIYRKGLTIEVGANDRRTLDSGISILTFAGGGGGTTTSFNDDGYLTFKAAITDGFDAILVAQTIADTDGDGFLDPDDQCPDDNPHGLDANADGCTDSPQDLIAMVERLDLNPGLKQAMTSQLEAAIAAAACGNEPAALRAVGAFAALVAAQRGKHVSPGDADLLLELANNVMTRLATNHRSAPRKEPNLTPVPAHPQTAVPVPRSP